MLRQRGNQRGIAMVEVLVAAVILAIGVSGLGILLLRAIQGTQDSAQKSQAIWIVQDFVGRIRANPVGARQGEYALNLSADCSVKPASICAEYYDGGVVPASVCEANEMAAFDRWITICGLNSDIYDSSSDFMVNPILESNCDLTSSRVSTSTGLPDCVQYNIKLTWDTRTQKGSTHEIERVQQNSYSTIVEVN